jgi:hypothetical protein
MVDWVVGVDLGGTKTEVGLIGPNNRIPGPPRVPTEDRLGPVSIVERIAALNRGCSSSSRAGSLLWGSARLDRSITFKGSCSILPIFQGCTICRWPLGCRRLGFPVCRPRCQGDRAGRVSLWGRARRAEHGLHHRWEPVSASAILADGQI